MPVKIGRDIDCCEMKPSCLGCQQLYCYILPINLTERVYNDINIDTESDKMSVLTQDVP